MKFKKNFLQAYLTSLILILAINSCISTANNLKNVLKNKNRFSFTEVSIHITNAEDELEFTSTVNLIKEGILIEPVTGINERLLKVISEKTEDEAEIFDWYHRV